MTDAPVESSPDLSPEAKGESKKPPRRMGLTLRHAREEKAFTLAACEKQLKIKEEYLLALENGHYHLLPTATHAKGFLRSYAIFLGLGSRLPELQHKFAEETLALPATPHLHMPQPLPEARLPTAKVAAAGIIGAVIVYILYVALQAPAEKTAVTELVQPVPPVVETALATPKPTGEGGPVQDTIPTPAQEAAIPATPKPIGEGGPPVEPVITETAASVVAPKSDIVEMPLKPVDIVPAAVLPKVVTPSPPAPPKMVPLPDIGQTTDRLSTTVSVKLLEDSWIQIQDSMGATIFSRLMKAGEDYTPPDLPGLSLTAGNASGVAIVRDGVEGEPLGDAAEVIKVKLTPKAKKQ